MAENTSSINGFTQLPIDRGDVLKAGTSGYQRTQLLKEKVINAQTHICIERAKLVTEAYRETEDENILIRRAKAFDKILRNMKVYIQDGELIVGHQAERQRSAPLFPEFAVQWIADEIDIFESRAQDKFKFLEEDKKIFLDEILPYWKGKTLSDHAKKYMTEEIGLLRFTANLFSLGIHEEGGFGHVWLDYEKVLVRGIGDIKKEVQGLLGGLKMYKSENLKKKLFYESVIIICDAVIAFANRYADEAERMAAVETGPERKKELCQIAEICRKVPEHPAETFHEALQSFWFVQLLPQIYDNGVSISPGRFDQYMYPYYERDIINGTCSKERCQELLEATWVKFSEPIKIYRAEDAAFHAGYPMGQNLAIGGITPEGLDATNDLSYRCLEAHRKMLLSQPNFSVRMHKKTPNDFIIKACEAIRLGNGMPQIVNDDVFIPSLLNLGVSLKDARDYALEGCVEATPRNAWGRGNGGYFNHAKVMELALNNGVCRITNRQVGPKTGDAREFCSFEQVCEAYEKQMDYAVQQLVTWNNIIDMVHEELMPVPFISILVDDCIKNGKDVTSGGAKYNWTGPPTVGIANVGDSFYAIKKAVFEDSRFTMKELINAVSDNYANNEEMRQYLINKVAKFGNDVFEADVMAKWATDVYFNTIRKHETYRGGPFIGGLVPVASYVPFGLTTGATTDGRKAREPLADGISPQNGFDLKGPTAVLKSVTILDHVCCPNGVILNIKLSPGTIATKEGLSKLVSLIKSYIDLKGAHIQFNIVSAKMLIEAQKNPEKYRGLVVRVAGYSAFFHELARDIQDTIIARTEHTL